MVRTVTSWHSWPQRISFPRGKAIIDYYSLRLIRLRESLRKRRIDGFLITNLINVRYLSGFTGTSGFIIVTRQRNVFVTDFRYKEEAERLFGDRDGHTPDVLRSSSPPRWETVIEKGYRLRTIRSLIKVLGMRSLGVEASITYDFFKGLSGLGIALRPLSGIVEDLRTVKDENEICVIRRAIGRAEAAFLDVKPSIRPGAKEKTIAAMLEERLKKRGCNHIPFDIIVASGDNAAMPHARATEKKLSPGDLVVVDWGGEAEGYFSDMTRTLLVRGGDMSQKKRIYQTVLTANKRAIASIRHGIQAHSVDSAARECIREAGYDQYFGHGTGHGVGLEVHELPRITWSRKDTLRDDMIFTVEPGIYLPGLGGVRIEDMVLVRKGSPEVLTQLPKDLEILSA